MKLILKQGEGTSVKEKPCFQAIKHVEGEVIRVGDSVLLRSGPRKTDLPFVARITALWESTDGKFFVTMEDLINSDHSG